MFSGIVEEAAKVVKVERIGGNMNIKFKGRFSNKFKKEQSVSHNGVCLTVVSFPEPGCYTVTAIQETLDRSNLGLLKPGDEVNVERSMKVDGRLDGHIVQGHVDQTATCADVREVDGSRYYTFRYTVDPKMAAKGYVTVEKGSVTVNGVSLTVCNSQRDSFEVAIIPYTYEHTNFHNIHSGTVVNIEFDIIGKYLSRMMEFVKPQ